jgi:hypothetical protein
MTSGEMLWESVKCKWFFKNSSNVIHLLSPQMRFDQAQITYNWLCSFWTSVVDCSRSASAFSSSCRALACFLKVSRSLFTTNPRMSNELKQTKLFQFQ